MPDSQIDYEAGESWKTGSELKQQRLAAYVEWLLTPVSMREPSSKTQFAASIGVTPQTLRNYEKDPHFQHDLASTARAAARVDRIPAILESLYNQATDANRPSVQAAKVFLDYVERVAPGEAQPQDLKSLSDEDLADLAVKLLQKVSGG